MFVRPRTALVLLALLAVASAAVSSSFLNRANRLRARVGANWVSATPTANKPPPPAPPPAPPAPVPQQTNSKVLKECDPAQTPALQGSDRPAKVAAFKACLEKLVRPVQVGLSRYQAEGRWDGSTFITLGDDVKFNSRTGKDPVTVQDAFTQGKETAIMVALVKMKCQGIEQSWLAAADSHIRKNKSLMQLYADFRAENPTLGLRSGTFDLNFRMKFCPYYIAAINEIYPLFYDFLLAAVQQSFPATKEAFKMPLKPSKIADDYWRTFVVGFGLGMPLNGNTGTGINTTGGRGVYFAMRISDVLGHGTKCKRCKLKADAKVVVLDEIDKGNIAIQDNYANAVAAGIFHPPPTKPPADSGLVTTTTPENQILNPNTKNIFGTPTEAEEALKGMAMIFRPAKLVVAGLGDNPYLADKGAIDYASCTDCSAEVPKF